MTGEVALGLAIATAIWNGDYEVEWHACAQPFDRRCVREFRRVGRQARALRAFVRHRRRVTRPWRGWLASTAACESHGNWRISTGNGYYGGLQFSLSTWQSVGGVGYPHLNPPLEQKYRGVILASTSGTHHWPVCG